MATQRWGRATIDFDRDSDSYNLSQHYAANLWIDSTLHHYEAAPTKGEALDRLAIWILTQKGKDE